VSVSTSPW